MLDLQSLLPSVSESTLIVSVVGVLITTAVLVSSLWNLYLSHYKPTRSDVTLSLEKDSEVSFKAGSGSIDENARWTGNMALRLVNSGEKGAYVSSEDYRLTGLKKNGEVGDSGPIYLNTPRSHESLVGKEIEPARTKRSRRRLDLETETDIEPLIEHDLAVIECSLTVQDEKGSYDVSGTFEAEIPGPEPALKNWEKHLQETAEE
ncbi:hypothetical protein [Halopelagius fulvigenes]|uniref:Uncharacterized protein n=1 Tax=Halopelagius fulvigenes TaxID=1198324 RepID=A0ABD5TXW9_9EURY